MRRSIVARLFALSSLLATATCSDDSSGTFTLSISGAPISISQGTTDSVSISLARASFDKPIVLTISGLPTGVTGTFQFTSVPGSVSTVRLELAVAPTATLGIATITVRANSSGQAEQVATMDLTVGLTGTYSLSSLDFPVTGAQGGGAIGTILVVRSGGHGDNVTLAASNAPSGVTAAFTASPTASSGTGLTLNVGAAVPVGSYPITITGTAPGLSDQTTQVTLNVIAPPATASFSMPFCANAVPAWFAYQNSGYTWQTVTPVNGVFTFNATSTLAIAYTYVFNTGQANETDLNIFYATRAEFAGRDNRDCAGAKAVTGSVTGMTSGQSTRVAMGAAFATPTVANSSFSLTGVFDRVLDLVAIKGNITTTLSNLQLTPQLLLIQRGINPSTTATVGALDFTTNGFAPNSTNLTIGNITTGDALNVGNTFWSSTSTYGIIHSFQPAGSTNTLFSMPSAKFEAGDLHELLVETIQPGFAYGRVNVAYLGPITADRVEPLAPNLGLPTASALTTSPYVRMRGQLSVQPEYPSATRFVYYQDGGGTSADRFIYVVATSGYLGATPASTWDVILPDFGSVSGLNTTWLPSTSFLIYQAEAYSSPGAVLFGAVPTAGDVFRVAYRVSTTGGLSPANIAAPAFRASLKREIQSGQYLRR